MPYFTQKNKNQSKQILHNGTIPYSVKHVQYKKLPIPYNVGIGSYQKTEPRLAAKCIINTLGYPQLLQNFHTGLLHRTLTTEEPRYHNRHKHPHYLYPDITTLVQKPAILLP